MTNNRILIISGHKLVRDFWRIVHTDVIAPTQMMDTSRITLKTVKRR